jgi:hypothetical protein
VPAGTRRMTIVDRCLFAFHGSVGGRLVESKAGRRRSANNDAPCNSTSHPSVFPAGPDDLMASPSSIWMRSTVWTARRGTRSPGSHGCRGEDHRHDSRAKCFAEAVPTLNNECQVRRGLGQKRRLALGTIVTSL